jgi:YHS domain-containing protein
MTRRKLFAGIALVLGVWLAQPALALDPIYTNWRGLALSGYDPVAYFTTGKPTPGSADFTFEWMGATWRFASAADRDAFRADPTRYAPQYGGYCAWAVSQGHTASSDPEAWRIVGGKLYLNYSRDVQAQWQTDVPGNIRRADRNWPGLRGAP